MDKRGEAGLVCAACGFENPPGMRFCGQCGALLEAPVAGEAAAEGASPEIALEDLIEIVEEVEPAIDLVEQVASPAKGPGQDLAGIVEKPAGTPALGDLIEVEQGEEPVEDLTGVEEERTEAQTREPVEERAPTLLTCTVCGADNSPTALHCEVCGAVVALAGAPCPTCGRLSGRGSLFCENCGERLGLADLF